MSLHANIRAVMADINARTTADAIHDALVESGAMPHGMGYGSVTAALRALCSEKKVRRDGLLNGDPAFELVAKPEKLEPAVEIPRFLGKPRRVFEPGGPELEADEFPGVNIDGPGRGIRPAPVADPVTWVGGYVLFPMACGDVLVAMPSKHISMVLPAEVIKAISRMAGSATEE